MRRLFTTDEAIAAGLTPAALRWGERKGRWRRVQRGVYGDGGDDPSPVDRARARVLAGHGVASGVLAGRLHRLDGLDGVALRARPTCRRAVAGEPLVTVEGTRCTDGLQNARRPGRGCSMTGDGSRPWSRRCASDW